MTNYYLQPLYAITPGRRTFIKYANGLDITYTSPFSLSSPTGQHHISLLLTLAISDMRLCADLPIHLLSI